MGMAMASAISTLAVAEGEASRCNGRDGGETRRMRRVSWPPEATADLACEIWALLPCRADAKPRVLPADSKGTGGFLRASRLLAAARVWTAQPAVQYEGQRQPVSTA